MVKWFGGFFSYVGVDEGELCVLKVNGRRGRQNFCGHIKEVNSDYIYRKL